MESLNTRLEHYFSFAEENKKQSTIKEPQHVFSFILNNNGTCITKNDMLNNFIHIEHALAVDSVNADILFAKTEQTHKMPLAIKKIPLNSYEMTYLKKLSTLDDITPDDIHKLNSDALTELYFLNLTTNLLKKKITNNLPFIYTHYLCNKCSFSNKRIIEKKNTDVGTCMYVATEKADGDLEHFVLRKDITKKNVYSAYLQIYIALHVLKSLFKIEHQDLHIGNVLYFNVKPGGYWKYIIKNKTIYVPNYGQLFILWDLAYSIIPNLVGASSNVDIYKNGKKFLFEDHRRVLEGLTYNNHRFDNQLRFFKNVLQTCKSTFGVISKVYEKITVPKNPKIIETFTLNKKV